MGWRTTIVFKPLFGQKDFIDKFEANARYEQADHGIGWVYEQLNGVTEKMCQEVADAFPGITFYGYQMDDTTCAQYDYAQIIFNKQDGVIFFGTLYYSDDEIMPIFDGLCIRGMKHRRPNESNELIEFERFDKTYDDEACGYCRPEYIKDKNIFTRE